MGHLRDAGPRAQHLLWEGGLPKSPGDGDRGSRPRCARSSLISEGECACLKAHGEQETGNLTGSLYRALAPCLAQVPSTATWLPALEKVCYDDP